MKTVLSEGKNPPSVFHFATKMGMEEIDFYKEFSSFDSIQEAIWKDLLANTQSRLEKSEEYHSFQVREKLLAFYYTLFEELLKNRSYVSWSLKGWANPLQKHPVRSIIQAEIKPYFETLLAEGFQNNELKNRIKGTKPGLKAFEFLFWFLIDFWVKDNSDQLEDTDAAVEKSVNLTIDLMKENTLDKALDLGKFLAGRLMPN